MNIVQLRNGRLAIADRGVLLAVPRMHPATSPATRRRVIEYVLRRQPTLAAMLAEDEADLIERRTSMGVEKLAKLMAEVPHRPGRAA